MEAKAYEYFAKIDELGGMVEAVKRSYPQREIADASFELQTEIDEGRRIVVGVNAFTEGDGDQTPILKIDPALERKQIDRVQAVRARRDGGAVEQALAAIRDAAARDGANLMEPLLTAARAEATEGEIVDSLQTVFGRYTEAPVF
jgi:methylmalonyl-CoA mutase N-terminal domain/subunit